MIVGAKGWEVRIAMSGVGRWGGSRQGGPRRPQTWVTSGLFLAGGDVGNGENGFGPLGIVIFGPRPVEREVARSSNSIGPISSQA